MAFSYRDLFCGGKTFCCCLPVRMGVISMAVLGMFFAGILSLVLWYEVASATGMTSGEKAGFILAGLVETFLFAASIFGFVGTIVRKQTFVQTYAYLLYIHFVLNIAVAGYLLYVISHFSENATVTACQQAIQNPDGEQQCTSLLKIAKGVYFVVAALVLLVELYGVIIVTRYVRQIKGEKRVARALRMGSESGIKLIPKDGTRYSTIPLQERGILHGHEPSYNSARDFDPYEEIEGSNYAAGPSYAYNDVPAPFVEAGYGGGSWTHEDISTEEKARLKQRDSQTETVAEPRQKPEEDVTDEEAEGRRSESKTPAGLPHPVRTREIEDLPRYALSDPPVPR